MINSVIIAPRSGRTTRPIRGRTEPAPHAMPPGRSAGATRTGATRGRPSHVALLV